MPPIGIEDC